MRRVALPLALLAALAWLYWRYDADGSNHVMEGV